MERRFNRNSYYNLNSQVLLVILYLTLPTGWTNVKNVEICSERRQKRLKQKQRDQERMKAFNERKSVCSLFPLATLDNSEIQEMTSKTVSVQLSKSEKQTLKGFQEELSTLNSSITVLKDDLKTANDKLKLTESQNAKLQVKLLEEISKFTALQTEFSKLQSELCAEQKLCQDIQIELSEFKKQTYNMVDKEVEHHRYIEKQHLQEVNELKNDIKRLKIELSNRTANTPHNEYVPGATGNSTMIQTGAHQGVGADMEKASSVETNQPRPTSVGAGQVPGCRKCGSIVSHQPSQCPAKNFVCEKCSKRGHHTFNCMHICAGCGGKRIPCYDPANCVAKNMNCAYCSVKGHLAHVCLQKRYDELGY